MYEKQIYAEMVRENYKPKTSIRLASLMKELANQNETKPRNINREQKDYLQELKLIR